MGILTRPRMLPQQRLDLEDWEVLLSSLRTDSKFWHSLVMTEESAIVRGFSIPLSVIGQTTASVVLADSMLFNPDASQDFSWYAAELAAPPLTIPSGAGGLQPGRNYVELVIGTETGTPLQRAFWDPSAASGAGVEFTNEVDTVTDLTISVVVNQSNFAIGDPDKVPLAIIDVNGSFAITGVQDKRRLFFRLGEPDNTTRNYPWGSRQEPTTTLTFTAASGTPYVTGEVISFTSGATATVVVGGTQNITARLFSNPNFQPGDTVTGADSGASASLQSYYESFVGADKDIANFRDLISAVQTEIKAIKGTDFWFENGTVLSLKTLLNYINAMVTPIATGARFVWSGTNLSITDDLTSGQTTADDIAAIRTLGATGLLTLTRQDGTGGSATIAVPDGHVLYVELPSAAATNRAYSESGPLVTNYRVASRAAFLPTDKNYVLAYREGNRLILKGIGELEPGEEVEIGDQTTLNILRFIGALNETDTTPPYTTVPSALLSNSFSSADSLTQAISVNAANINDIAEGITKVYYESLLVTSAVAANDNEIQGPLAPGATLTLPLDSRDSDAAKSYVVGRGALMVFRNGVMQSVGHDYLELGSPGQSSTQIDFMNALEVGENIEFRILVPELIGTGAIPQPFFRNYVSGQSGTLIPTGDIYNIGTDKLQVYRNGVAMINTAILGDAIDRYQEVSNTGVTVSTAAAPADVFVFLNRADGADATLITGVTGTALTVPTYTLGTGELKLFKNGVLQTTEAGAPAAMRYTETSTTELTLATAAVAGDVFQVYITDTAPTWRETLTGATGTTITIPNSQTYTQGDDRLQVYRNGILLLNDLALSTPSFRYQEVLAGDEIELEEALTISDVLEFIYI